METARRVWLYWAQKPGAPPRAAFLEACRESVVRNSGCEVLEVSDATIGRYVPSLHAAFPLLTPNHQADVFRLNVLALHGGMYLDFDTVVLRSLAPLFDALAEHELVGADWKPEASPRSEWESLGVGCIGPCRPGLPFLRACVEAQRAVLDGALEGLRRGGDYPLSFGALCPDLVGRTFDRLAPKALLRDGASSWFALVGGRDWWGGALGHAFRKWDEVGALPDSELFTLSNALTPPEVRAASLDELLAGDTVLSELLRRARTAPR